MPAPDDAIAHLYVHVPFCRRRCSYCDFAIAVRRRVPAADYVAVIGRELALLARSADVTMGTLETVYLGGGTPSLLPPPALGETLAAVAGSWSLAADAEVTLEANPEDVTPEAARAWRKAGVNRVSLGVQSFHEPTLGWMHRPHGAGAPAAAVRALREAGVENVSIDLIFGLPRSLGRDWRRDLDRALALEPAHISLYGLTVESRTPLARWVERGAAAVATDEQYGAEYLLAHEVLTRAGYAFYELSNAAAGGRRSRHNLAYWSGGAYVGVGPAAHSYLGDERRWNEAAWVAYRQAVLSGKLPVAGRERLDEEARRLERAYLRLRTADGLPLDHVDRGVLEGWCEAGWAAVRGDRMALTPEGWLVIDRLALDLTDCQYTS